MFHRTKPWHRACYTPVHIRRQKRYFLTGHSEGVLSASNSDPGAIWCRNTASLRFSSPSFPTCARVSCFIVAYVLCNSTEFLGTNGLLVAGNSGRLSAAFMPVTDLEMLAVVGYQIRLMFTSCRRHICHPSTTIQLHKSQQCTCAVR